MLIILLFCFALVLESAPAAEQKRSVDLPIVLDDVDGVTVPVGEGGDVLVSSVPSHFSATALKSLDERDNLIGCHVNPSVSDLLLRGAHTCI